jgi:hypothetical protein
MVPLIIIALIVGIIVFGLGFLGAALHFLFIIGVIIVVIALIGWLLRAIRGRA